jgi:hypothetical protein
VGEFSLGGEAAFGGDAGGLAAVHIVRPRLGQIQLPVHQCPPPAGGVGGEDADLAVPGPPGRAGVLPLHPGGDDALLEESGVVHDQDAVRGAEPLGHVLLHVVPEFVGVPSAVREQVL